MTTIHATPGALSDDPGSGIRPFDIGRDLRPVAELIAEAFASELDPRGNAALREMRVMSHMGGFLKLLNRTTGDFNDVFNGFVWVEDGRVVGNVTVQRADRYASRWQIANVAVAPAYRGRGIARRLMDRAIGYIQEGGGRWAVLQVYAANRAARTLYDKMNFEYVGGHADLRLESAPPHRVLAAMDEDVPNFYTFGAAHWQELYELANHQLSAQAQWWRGVRRNDYQITLEQQVGEWFAQALGRRRVYRGCIQVSRRFEAAIVLTAQRWSGEHQVRLWARPESFGQFEAPLLRWALFTLDEYPRFPVTLELNTEHTQAMDAAQALGFQVTRTLLTMRKPVQPQAISG